VGNAATALALGVAVLAAACSSGESASPPPPSAAASTTIAATSTSTSSTTSSTTTTTVQAPRPRPPAALVDVQELEPSIVVALNKLTADNVTGAPLPGYEANRAFLQPAGAEALARVQRRLAGRGLGLKVFDGYRPVRATQALVAWARAQGRADLVGPYIASVSYHNSGQAVDLTLVDRATSRELDMGTGYETFTPAAHTANATGVAAENRAVLVEAMHAEGFENYVGEWWHFYYYVTGATLIDEPIR
jgi:D-alanyl-D-alanine dipeptidase